MDIYITSHIGPCTEFMEKTGSLKKEISVVISPLKIISKDDVLKVTSGCSMFHGCMNTKCSYSLSGLKLRKGEK